MPDNTKNRKSLRPAPSGRASDTELRTAITALHDSKQIGHLLHCMGSIVVILNENRQILAANDALLDLLGLDSADDLLGQRPGEAMNCSYASDGPDGCGTGEACHECGAVLAIISALQTNEPAEQECLLSIGKNASAMELKVRAIPVTVDGNRLILVSLDDIRSNKRQQALERIFFHDVMNSVSSLNIQVELLEKAPAETHGSILQKTRQTLQQLTDDIREQQILSMVENQSYQVRAFPVSANTLIEQLQQLFPPASGQKQKFLCTRAEPDITLTTDPMLLKRVLVNMLKNAFEATANGGQVKLGCAPAPETGGQILWTVWNQGEIPRRVAPRVFQRYFTTKPENGRGIGAYSMRLLGEQYLGGRVWFETDPKTGTSFFFLMPREIMPPGRS